MLMTARGPDLKSLSEILNPLKVVCVHWNQSLSNFGYC